MKSYPKIILLMILFLIGTHSSKAATEGEWPYAYFSHVVFEGDTILHVQLWNIYVYPKLVFKTDKEEWEYNRLIRNVKRTLPIAKRINEILIETYQFVETLPSKSAKEKHLKLVEKSIYNQYQAEFKQLTVSQGKLLIKLIDRECDQSSYDLIKVIIGRFKAKFYQSFASVFGMSLKAQYDPKGEDKLTERVITLVENHQL